MDSPSGSSDRSTDTPDIMPQIPDTSGRRFQNMINYGTSRLRAAVMAHHEEVRLHPALEDDYVNPEVERTPSDRNLRTYWEINTAWEIVSPKGIISPTSGGLADTGLLKSDILIAIGICSVNGFVPRVNHLLQQAQMSLKPRRIGDGNYWIVDWRLFSLEQMDDPPDDDTRVLDRYLDDWWKTQEYREGSWVMEPNEHLALYEEQVSVCHKFSNND